MPKIAFEKIPSKWLFSDFVSKIKINISKHLANASDCDIRQMKGLDLLYLLNA